MQFRDPRFRPWWSERHPFGALCLLAFAVTLVMEMLSRRSPLAGVEYVGVATLAFFCNFLIVLLTLTPSLLMPRRAFWNTVLCTVWLGLATANCIVLGFRITPISAIDLTMIKSVRSIINLYLKPVQLILVIAAAFAVLCLFLRVWARSERTHPRLLRGLIALGGTALSLALILPLSLQSGALSGSFYNLGTAYKDYGFAYCFSCSLVDRGVDRPEDYSDEEVSDLVEGLDKESDPAPDPAAEDTKPNVIFIQLESYFDPARITALTCAEDPIPNFRALEATSSHGWLTVPSIGAGTANTEFEVLTGMSLDYFGAGEYPYETILQKTACESLCTDLRAEGYASHAIHNHKGGFYDRNRVFASLGFDTFSSLEYMSRVRKNPIGWAGDDVLTGEITKALTSTEERDFIYTITVQAHGKYPREQLADVPYMDNAGFGDDADHWAWGYYLTQLKATDEFIGRLISVLEGWSEPCVVVMYGDHMPNFSISDEDLNAGNTFQTEYLIWSNFGLEKQDRDLSSYQLGAEVLGRLGFDEGVLTKLHQNRADDPDYEQTLQLLEYDLLYGDRAAIGGAELRPTDLQMGTLPITVTKAENEDGNLFISGENFTLWSEVRINGHAQETAFGDCRTLIVLDTALEPGDRVTVAQVSTDGLELSETAEYIYGNR